MNRAGGLVVREAHEGEAAAVGALILVAFEEYRPLVAPDFMTGFEAEVGTGPRDAGGLVLVAEEGGADSGWLAGTVTLLPDGSGSGAHGWPEAVPVLRLLATHPAARGRGIGRALAEACVTHARDLGASEIGLHTAPFMRAARELYESLGFARAPELDLEMPGAPPALAYLLQL